MDHALLFMNFNDAISEGDGNRLMRCWKFFLLHFYADSGSSKYSLEALYLQFQQQALLTPREAYRQRWNRSCNNHGHNGKNVPLDIELEHNNNLLKEAVRKMGPNLTTTTVKRAGKMVNMAKGMINQTSRECCMMRRSGEHFAKKTKKDLATLVESLFEEKAMENIPGRSYKHFAKVPRSSLKKLNMNALCKWVNQHKYKMMIGRKAR